MRWRGRRLGRRRGGDAHAPGEDAHGPAIEAFTDRVVTHRHVVGPGDVAVSTLPPWTVGEDVVVLSVRLGATSGRVELVAARLSSAPEGCARGARGAPDARDARDAAGARVAAGERPSLELHLRGGPGIVSEVVVRYATDEGETELRWNAVRVELAPRPAGAPRDLGCRTS